MIGVWRWATLNGMILFVHTESHMWQQKKMKRPLRLDDTMLIGEKDWLYLAPYNTGVSTNLL